METIISIRKSLDFSKRSNVYILNNNETIYLNDYKSYRIKLSSRTGFIVKQQWIKSKEFQIKEFEMNGIYEIFPLLGKKFAFVFLAISSFCIISFFVTHKLWLTIPLLLMGIYILGIITIFSSHYFRIRKVTE